MYFIDKSEYSRGVVLELFREIYSFILIGDIKDSSLTRLHMCGLVKHTNRIIK